MKAIYVSVWDGCTTIESNCNYDDHLNVVSDVEIIDVDGMDINVLTDEYVILPNGQEIREFTYTD